MGLEEIWSARHADKAGDDSGTFAALSWPVAAPVDSAAPSVPVAPAAAVLAGPLEAVASCTPHTSSSAATNWRILHRRSRDRSPATTLTCYSVVALLSIVLVVAVLLGDDVQVDVSLPALVDADELAATGTRATAMVVGLLGLVGALWSAGGARAYHRAAGRAHAAATSLAFRVHDQTGRHAGPSTPALNETDETTPVASRASEDAQRMSGHRAERRA